MTETVYLKRRFRVQSKQDQVYHTSKECQHYRKSADERRFREVSKQDIPDEARICKECSGDSHRKSTQNRGMNELLSREDFQPEDIGLSPMGER